MPDELRQYLQTLPAERRGPVSRLWEHVRDNIDSGFQEIHRPNPAFVVPLGAFPDGYHCRPGTPLPYLNLESRKTGITLHHFGVYMNPELRDWFAGEYTRQTGEKPDLGKGCVRFRKMDSIPYELIGQLTGRQTLSDFIKGYERAMSGRTGKKVAGHER